MSKLRLSMPDYLARPEVSKHDLDLFSYEAGGCPAKYIAKKSGQIRSEPTPAMQFGTAVHAAVFEARRDYVVKPETYESEKGELKPWNGNASVCRAWMQANEGESILSAAEDAKIDAICRAVRSDSRAAHLIAQGEAEVSLFATDPASGLAIKGRPDFITADGRAIVDLKTASDASTAAFMREVVNYRYHVQAAYYFRLMRLNGMEPAAFYFLVVENGPLPLLNVRKLSQGAIDFADATITEELDALAGCMASGKWPGYSGEGEAIEELHLPDWAYHNSTEIEFGGETVTV